MKRWKPSLGENENISAYHKVLDNKLESENPQCLEDLRHIMKSCATSLEEDHEKRDHPWMTQEIHMLINRRRGESNRHIRRDISKKIQQKMRQAIRKYKDQQIDQVLEEFQDLNRLQQIGIQNKIAESYDKLKMMILQRCCRLFMQIRMHHLVLLIILTYCHKLQVLRCSTLSKHYLR